MTDRPRINVRALLTDLERDKISQGKLSRQDKSKIRKRFTIVIPRLLRDLQIIHDSDEFVGLVNYWNDIRFLPEIQQYLSVLGVRVQNADLYRFRIKYKNGFVWKRGLTSREYSSMTGKDLINPQYPLTNLHHYTKRLLKKALAIDPKLYDKIPDREEQAVNLNKIITIRKDTRTDFNKPQPYSKY